MTSFSGVYQALCVDLRKVKLEGVIFRVLGSNVWKIHPGFVPMVLGSNVLGLFLLFFFFFGVEEVVVWGLLANEV